MIRTLGSTIRAARLGWFASPTMEAWVRMSDGPHGLVRVEVAPGDKSPPGSTAVKEYRCIGDGESGGGTEIQPEILSLSPVLRAIKRVKKASVFMLNDDGTLAASEEHKWQRT